MRDKFLPIKEVAKILGVTPLTLRNWDKKGLLAAARNPINNYRVYSYSAIADFIIEIQKGAKKVKSPLKIQVISED